MCFAISNITKNHASAISYDFVKVLKEIVFFENFGKFLVFAKNM